MATILVVEDETEVREAIAKVLGAAGHKVVQAVDGRDGLDRYHEHRPKLILCDILMPERDGLEMITALRGDGIQVPVVAMLEPDAAQANLLLNLAMALGAREVLLKPVMVSELLHTTAKLLAPVLPNLKPRAD
ncbi:response regulator [Phenylobacterium sp.]|uniref:response regulator transcription factor n=1 Tax=Phenylobacterium sp. TaxID=1871053 RepID=UPI0025D83CB7|nr:response regulator [Phenylobacterium sp.]